MTKELVSIIIPVYNRANLISETLDTIVSQSYTNWECIVVDDGSKDATFQILTTYKNKDDRFKIHKRPNDRPKGANTCRNYGLENSEGKYLLFLDSDDLLKNTCLENRIAAFETNKELDFVIANTSYYKNTIFGEMPVCEFPEETKSKTYLNHFLRYELPWTIMGVLWKQDTIKGIRFDEQLTRFQDVDFHIRVLLNSDYNTMRLQQVDNFYRIEESEKFSKKQFQNTLKGYRDLFKKLEIIEGQEDKINLRQFSATIYTQFVAPYFSLDKELSNKLFRFSLKSNLYTFKQKMMFILFKIILNLGLYNAKGIGINKFRKYFNKVISK